MKKKEAEALRAAYEAGAAKEREACAKIADEYANSPRTIGCGLVANDIRARGGSTATFPALPVDPEADKQVDAMLAKARNRGGNK